MLVEQTPVSPFQVTEVRESDGSVAGYRCPQCGQVFTLQEQADGCLREHARMLCD